MTKYARRTYRTLDRLNSVVARGQYHSKAGGNVQCNRRGSRMLLSEEVRHCPRDSDVGAESDTDRRGFRSEMAKERVAFPAGVLVQAIGGRSPVGCGCSSEDESWQLQALGRRRHSVERDTEKDSDKAPGVLACDQWRTPIARLFDLRGPSAISRLIVAIVVNAMKGHSHQRLLAHIDEKVCETGAPTVAYHDAPRTITVEVAAFRVVTILEHPAPRRILRSMAFSGRIFQGRGVRHYAPKTSTAFRSPTLQRMTGNFFGEAAIAPAQPTDLAIRGMVISAMQHGPASKPLSSKVRNLLCHAGTIPDWTPVCQDEQAANL